MVFHKRGKAGRHDGSGDDPGRGRPRVSMTGFDDAPREVMAQAPLEGELLGVIPGPDRPDYCAILLDRPLYLLPPSDLELARVEPGTIVRDGERVSIRVNAVIVCARLVGEQIGPDSTRLAVNVAAVIDNTALRDPVLAFVKLHVLGVGLFSHL
jgi:hypothetical protein